MPVRVLFTHFIAFMQDKACVPSFSAARSMDAGDRIQLICRRCSIAKAPCSWISQTMTASFPACVMIGITGDPRGSTSFYGAVVLYDMVGQ